MQDVSCFPALCLDEKILMSRKGRTGLLSAASGANRTRRIVIWSSWVKRKGAGKPEGLVDGAVLANAFCRHVFFGGVSITGCVTQGETTKELIENLYDTFEGRLKIEISTGRASL
jgi:hypothetical protein